MTLSPGQTSDCTTPALDLFTVVDGTPVNVAELEFQIFEDVTTPGTPVQVFPPVGRQAVDVDNDCPIGHRLSTGRYVAEWSVPVDEPIGPHLIRWYFRLTPLADEQTFDEAFTVAPVIASSSIGYCSVQDVRDEGVTVALASDAKVQRLIRVATAYIDEYTGRFFSPRHLTITLNGRGHSLLQLDMPIIAINRAVVELIPGSSEDPSELDLEDLVVYNRHITQGLFDPDDRNNPRIEFARASPGLIRAAVGSAFLVWPDGRGNVTLEGVFGYTDPDGTPYGRTPILITEACLRLVMRLLPLKVKSVLVGAGPIWKEVTRDQRVEFANPDRLAIQGAFTGDPEIDTILARYRRPPKFGAT
jgi:hypothetical protein